MPISRLSIILNNQAGALARVITLFRRRSVNIVALSVGETEDSRLSRLTILSDAADDSIKHMQLQLLKLEEVRAAQILPNDQYIERELVLVKIAQSSLGETELDQLVKRYDLRILAKDKRVYILEISQENSVIQEFIEEIRPLGILELSRTGETALRTGLNTLYNNIVR